MKICKDCHIEKETTEYYGYQNDCKDCYKARVRTQKDRLGIARTCMECAVSFKALQSEINRGGGKTCSRDCYYKYLSKMLDKKNDGMVMAYGSVHHWIKRKLGKPSYCEFCKTTKGAFDWSNKSGQYLREVTDWQRLCRKCHAKYDDQPTTRKKTMLKKYGTLDTYKAKLIKDSHSST